jgi:hypothetical protein
MAALTSTRGDTLDPDDPVEDMETSEWGADVGTSVAGWAYARYAEKRDTSWIGYKVHLTKTCEADRPNPITDVQTTAAGMPDGAMTAPVHSALAARGLLPDVVDAALLVASQVDQAVDLLGSV